MEDQWNKPGLNEHYLMLIVDAVRNVLSGDQREIDLSKVQIPFERRVPSQEDFLTEEEDIERRSEEARRILVARAGGVIRGLDSQGNPI